LSGNAPSSGFATFSPTKAWGEGARFMSRENQSDDIA
jgi:hypothetical protein